MSTFDPLRRSGGASAFDPLQTFAPNATRRAKQATEAEARGGARVRTMFGIGAAAITIAACAAAPPPQSTHVHLFQGSRQAWAMTADRSGGNLPSEYRPWRYVASYDRSDPRFRVGRDRESLVAVDANGYSLTFISASIEIPPR